jgi:UDP-2-acetamido-2,6-beta-L-arabino-hexul-4-ose reductase
MSNAEQPGSLPRVAITGATGLIGWHVAVGLRAQAAWRVRPLDRSAFADAGSLEAAIEGCEAIVHCAGANRGDDAAVAAINAGLARALAAAVRRTGARAHFVFANSVHGGNESAYGRSKAEAAAVLAEAAAAGGGRFTDLVLPHVFGEHGRPFHNSVVSTFCHQLAAGGEPTCHGDGRVELVHAGDVADEIGRLLASPARRGEESVHRVRMRGRPMGVRALLARLEALARRYAEGTLPDVSDPLDLRLFNAYRSYRFPQAYPVALRPRADARGVLVEAVRTDGGGQSFFSETGAGITRGNHFHRHKVERFVVVRGEAEIAVRPVLKQRVERFAVSGDRPAFVDIPTLHTHKITNRGSGDLLTLFWAHEAFDPANPDTFAEEV